MAQAQDSKVPIDEMLGEFERKLDRLRFQYEQYFLGIDRVEPAQLKKDVFRLQHALEQENMTSASNRFRYRSLCQRYNSYKSYWARTLRQIEAGTYARSVARLEREMRKKGVPIESLRGKKTAAQIEAALLRATSAAKPDAAAPAPAPPSSPPPERPVPPALPGGMSRDEAAQLHRSYAEARRQCGQTGSLDFASFMSTLGQRADAIRAKYGASEVRFQVAVRDGKPVLQAIPKK